METRDLEKSQLSVDLCKRGKQQKHFVSACADTRSKELGWQRVAWAGGRLSPVSCHHRVAQDKAPSTHSHTAEVFLMLHIL